MRRSETSLPPPIVEDQVELSVGPLPTTRDLFPDPALRPSRRPSTPPLPRRSARPSLQAAAYHTLIAPPLPRAVTRGIGVIACVLGGAVTGLADGLRAMTRSEGLTGGSAALVVAHCVATTTLVSLALGLLCEALLSAGTRVAPVRQLWSWLGRGPRAWFARDPGRATRLLLAAVGLSLTFGPVFSVSRFVIAHFHAPALMALAIALSCLASLVVATFAVVLLAPPARWALGRVGRAASPGALGVALLAASAALARSFWVNNRVAFAGLDLEVMRMALLFPATALVTTLAIVFAGRSRRTSSALPIARRWPALAAAAAVLAGAASGATLGVRQQIAASVTTGSMVTGWEVRALQALTDTDGDGASALFNGGDCDDRDPGLHPAARDVPGNGVDENCSGSDARALREPSDGAPVADTGLAAGVRPSFLVISVDTLRRDHVGAYGYARPTTPNLDAFARGAARFDNAYTTSPNTLRALASLWTGRYPSRITWVADGDNSSLEERNVTLAETLRDAGYETGAFLGTDYFLHHGGFLQGFAMRRNGDAAKGDVWRTVAEAAEWVRANEAREAPFFGWVHLIEPHLPYRDLTEPRDFGHSPVDRYDEEVARADAAVGRLLEAADGFTARHPDRPLVVIVTADHGEGLGAHGSSGHGYSMHEESMRIPLIVRAPGAPPGPRASLASLVDVYASVLNYAGMAVAAPVAGRSLVGALRDPAAPQVGGGWRERLFAEVLPMGVMAFRYRTLYQPPYKLLWDERDGTWELYDLSRDAQEAVNLFNDRPGLAVRMREDLMTWAYGGDGPAPALTPPASAR